jgi:predicted DNA repair protein MutK
VAGSSLLALLDDIASVLDDVSVMTKVAARKTAGVLGDDLALNAQQVTGVRAERELPVVWAVALGSLRNKAILVPAALLVSVLAPWAITPLLMVGGGYLCFEGVEKLAHKFLHPKEEKRHQEELVQALTDPEVDLRALERDKIKGAIRTDFVLSAEIIVITLGTVAGVAFGLQVAVLVGIALLMTVGVYGLVAGTAAMFLVGGGILVHGLPWLHELIHGVAHEAELIPGVGVILAGVTPALMNALVGVLAGALLLGAVTLGQRVWRGLKPAEDQGD